MSYSRPIRRLGDESRTQEHVRIYGGRRVLQQGYHAIGDDAPAQTLVNKAGDVVHSNRQGRVGDNVYRRRASAEATAAGGKAGAAQAQETATTPQIPAAIATAFGGEWDTRFDPNTGEPIDAARAASIYAALPKDPTTKQVLPPSKAALYDASRGTGGLGPGWNPEDATKDNATKDNATKGVSKPGYRAMKLDGKRYQSSVRGDTLVEDELTGAVTIEAARKRGYIRGTTAAGTYEQKQAGYGLNFTKAGGIATAAVTPARSGLTLDLIDYLDTLA